MASGPPESEASADLDALSVVLALRSGPIAGEIVSLEITQTTVDFRPPDVPLVPLGVVVTLEFQSADLKRKVRLGAIVTGRAEVAGCRRYTFQFKLKEGQDAGDLFRLFNRRSSFRAASNKPVVVSVWPADPAAREHAKPIQAEMHDISATGIAVIVTPEQDMKIAQDQVMLEFELPSSTTVIRMLTTIRYRVLIHSKAIRYGCAFDPATAGFAAFEDLVMRYLMKHQQQLLKYRGEAD